MIELNTKNHLRNDVWVNDCMFASANVLNNVLINRRKDVWKNVWVNITYNILRDLYNHTKQI